jgi:protein TonB
MPAPAQLRPRERLAALAAVGLVQLALGFALFLGFRVQFDHPVEVVQRLVEIALPRAPPPVLTLLARRRDRLRESPAPEATPQPLGGARGPSPAHTIAAVQPLVTIAPSKFSSGGGAGVGPAAGSGVGGGAGGAGIGENEGGTDLIKIAGEILPSDYPRSLGNAGIGGRVGVTFTVETNGRVTDCRVTRSSGVPQLDALTCRLMTERFRFRPSMDRYGRPVRDEVDWDHDWVAGRSR